ncbi:MAG TPA: primosomal replication protein N [Oxalobacteraceae bacterium]|nr:primosomal replication protein N [Oxalobacteraceae bacterium]
MNRLELLATIAERDVLRYTPAGIPIASGKLLHASKVVEAGVERQVEFEIAALAAGEISGRFNQAELGVTYQFKGFLARKNRNSKSLVFHILEIAGQNPDDWGQS